MTLPTWLRDFLEVLARCNAKHEEGYTCSLHYWHQGVHVALGPKRRIYRMWSRKVDQSSADLTRKGVTR